MKSNASLIKTDKVESINPYTSTLNISPNAATKWFTNVNKPRSDSYSSKLINDEELAELLSGPN
jgi:hypothetical protein